MSVNKYRAELLQAKRELLDALPADIPIDNLNLVMDCLTKATHIAHEMGKVETLKGMQSHLARIKPH